MNIEKYKYLGKERRRLRHRDEGREEDRERGGKDCEKKTEIE